MPRSPGTSRWTPLELLDRRRGTTFGVGAWLGQPGAADRPFVLVLAQFFPGSDPYTGCATWTR